MCGVRATELEPSQVQGACGLGCSGVWPGFIRIIDWICGSGLGVNAVSDESLKIVPRVAPGNADFRHENESDEGFVPLNAEQAREWRSRNPPLSLWRVLAIQVVAGGAAALLAWLVTDAQGGRSAAWGAVAVALPAALFARGLSRATTGNAGGALAALFVWEGAKLLLTLALLGLAYKVLGSVNWLALLAGFVVTLKSYWLALWWLAARRRHQGATAGGCA